MRILWLLLLCGCAPALVATGERDPLKLFIAPYGEYVSLQVDSGPELALNAVVRFSGSDLRFNDPRCTINNRDVTCALGNINTFVLPFIGTMLNASVSYYRKDGSAHKVDIGK